MAQTSLKIFQYIADLDCFIVAEPYRRLADQLGLAEWSPVVWIGRLFLVDNDVGEHWFDNWELREQLRPEAEKRGIAYEDLLIIDPQRFQNGADGRCHDPEQRKRFWTDVLRSLELSYDLLFAEARSVNTWNQQWNIEAYLPDLEQRIERIQQENTPSGDAST
jgi:hypothetical protein